jgi:signal transduction histidine kinase
VIEKAKQHRQNLEFMVASRKLKQDLLAQANLVKDELQLLQGAWKSNIHSIINDLPDIKERELYRQIILPFQDNIIRHLRDLESGLTFDMKSVLLSELYEFLTLKIKNNLKMGTCGAGVVVEERGWQESRDQVLVDKSKVWDMVLNVLRNSQAALELKQIEMLRAGKPRDFQPRISVTFARRDSSAELEIIDNGGGASPEHVNSLYREPVPSRKRGGKTLGEGALFVKFFAERMGISVRAENTRKLGDDGLAVMIQTPLALIEP